MFTGSLVTKQSILTEFIFRFLRIAYDSHDIVFLSYSNSIMHSFPYTRTHIRTQTAILMDEKKEAKTTRTKEEARKKTWQQLEPNCWVKRGVKEQKKAHEWFHSMVRFFVCIVFNL